MASDVTIVSRLISGQKSELTRFAAELNRFILDDPRRRVAVTHAALALSVSADEPKWQQLADQVNAYFAGIATVTAINLKRFIWRISRTPTGQHLAGWLCLYLLHLIDSNDEDIKNHAAIIEAEDLSGLFAAVRAFASRTPPSISALEKDQGAAGEIALDQLVDAARKILRVDKESEKRLFADIFGQDHNTSKISFKDEAYYVMYNYSNISNKITKTFIVVSSPGQNGVDYFSYSHFYRNKEDSQSRNSQGAIFCFENSYYFIGGSSHFTSHRYSTSLGLKLLAISHRQIRQRISQIVGLHVSNDQNWMPITGLVAMVKLGTREELGRSISDDDIQPGVFKAGSLKRDITETFKRINIPMPPSGGENLAKFVLRNINNTADPKRRSKEKYNKQAIGLP